MFIEFENGVIIKIDKILTLEEIEEIAGQMKPELEKSEKKILKKGKTKNGLQYKVKE